MRNILKDNKVEKTHFFFLIWMLQPFFFYMNSAVLRSQEEMKPLLFCARDSSPPNTRSPQGHPIAVCPTLTPHRGWMWLCLGGRNIKNIKKWNSSLCLISLPGLQFRGATKGRGINEKYERGMARDERKREMKELFEAKSHFSGVATQSGLQWSRGTSLSLQPMSKSPFSCEVLSSVLFVHSKEKHP